MLALRDAAPGRALGPEPSVEAPIDLSQKPDFRHRRRVTNAWALVK
jgi:hypothetical protein